jgi:predicted MFS family arabinose efflux permease
MRHYLRVLRDNPDFARLWGANVVSLLGDWFTPIVLSTVIVRHYPQSEGLAVSLLLLARFVPQMALSPYAGVLIDRFNRKHLLIGSNLLRGVVVLGFIPVVNNPDLIGWVYGLTILQFTLASVFEPGQASLINRLVKLQDLVAANTLFSITWSVMLAFGAAVGGFVTEFLDRTAALAFDSLSFVVGAWLIYRIASYQYEPRQQETHHGEGTSFRDGLRYLRQRPDLASILMVKFGNSLGNVDLLMTIYATQIFILGEGGQLSLSILYSAFGIGAVMGPLLLNRFNDGSVERMRTLITIGFVFSTVCWLVLASAQSLWLAAFALLIRAMGGSANWTYSSIIIQKTGEDRYLGRIFSLDMMAFYIATIASTVIHGSAVDIVGSQNANLVAFATTFIAILPFVAWMIVNRWLRRRQPVQLAAAD